MQVVSLFTLKDATTKIYQETAKYFIFPSIGFIIAFCNNLLKLLKLKNHI